MYIYICKIIYVYIYLTNLAREEPFLRGGTSRLRSDDDDDVYLDYYSGKGFDINYSIYMSYV
jgi:hypothetical protein